MLVNMPLRLAAVGCSFQRALHCIRS